MNRSEGDNQKVFFHSASISPGIHLLAYFLVEIAIKKFPFKHSL